MASRYHNIYKNEKDNGYQIVRYGNELVKKLPLNSLNQNELNLFITICASLTRNKEVCADYLSLNWFKELMGVSNNNLTNDELKQLFTSTFKKLNANYMVITPNEKSCIYFRMFDSFGYEYKPKSQKEYVFYRLSPTFRKFFQDLVKEYTTFYLLEMTSIKGLYAKRLFMLLKQFRKVVDPESNGVWKTLKEWNELLGVPSGYQTFQFMNRIINPAVKELKKYKHFEDLIVKKTVVRKQLKAIGFYWSKEMENPKGMLKCLPNKDEESFDEIEFGILMEYFDGVITQEQYEEKIDLYRKSLEGKNLNNDEKDKINPFKVPEKNNG